jgi:hypothetical protein
MYKLLNNHKLKLLYTRDKLITKDMFESMNGWVPLGDWHVMTIDTNEDKSSGLDGNIAIQTAGSYGGGAMTKEIIVETYSEILFEYYVQNPKWDTEPNKLTFYIDGVKKLEADGPCPWQRCSPIGLTPGKHEVKFEYQFTGAPDGKKAVVDTFTVWQGKQVDCLVTEYKPAKPSKSLGSSNILRGFTRYQEMAVADTEINFTSAFNGLSFLEFMQKSDEAFYFVDEFGVCYRGIFPKTIEPKNIAMNEVYFIELSFNADQKTGFGFC